MTESTNTGATDTTDARSAIHARRSIKRFTEREVTRREIEALLDAAVRAPNHRLTEPWRFYVLGPTARRAYGAALGARKAKRVEDPDAAAQVRDKVADDHATLPAMVALAVQVAEDPEVREEDYAAAMMALQNLCLAALDFGLGTHIKTGAVMADPAARAAVGVPDGERIVAIVNIGEAAEPPPERPRAPASEKTIWVD
jgi:nitroreductase